MVGPSRGRKKDAESELPKLHCSHEGCGKSFRFGFDLSKHEKTHNRHFKCHVVGCEYEEYGLQTEKELDRHVSDKHNVKPRMYKCMFCDFQSKRESNCEQHIEKIHNWNLQSSKGKERDLDEAQVGKSINVTTKTTPSTDLEAEHPSEPPENPDIIYVRCERQSWTVEFPPYSIAEGKVTFQHIRERVAQGLGVNEREHQIVLVYRGQDLADDDDPICEHGCKQHSEILALVPSYTATIASHGAENVTDDKMHTNRTSSGFNLNFHSATQRASEITVETFDYETFLSAPGDPEFANTAVDTSMEITLLRVSSI